MKVETLVGRNFTTNHDQDFTCKGQIERIKSKPLVTEDASLTTGKSCKGRAYVLLEGLLCIPKAFIATVNNIVYIAEKAIGFLRATLELNKADMKATGKALVGGIGALTLRPITFVTDSAKLFAGLFHPKAAISHVLTPIQPTLEEALTAVAGTLADKLEAEYKKNLTREQVQAIVKSFNDQINSTVLA